MPTTALQQAPLVTGFWPDKIQEVSKMGTNSGSIPQIIKIGVKNPPTTENARTSSIISVATLAWILRFNFGRLLNLNVDQRSLHKDRHDGEHSGRADKADRCPGRIQKPQRNQRNRDRGNTTQHCWSKSGFQHLALASHPARAVNVLTLLLDRGYPRLHLPGKLHRREREQKRLCPPSKEQQVKGFTIRKIQEIVTSPLTLPWELTDPVALK